jgi:hypothetical protein
MMKWGPVIFFYSLMLLSIQTSLYLISPKAYYGCVRPAVPRTANWVTFTQEYIYCFQSDDGFKIATLNDFEASYFDVDPTLHPITIADFQWIEFGSVFKKYSLLSIGDHRRRLHFSARTGSQGEYQAVPNETLGQLQQHIALTTLRARYFQPANNTISIPILDIPMFFVKLLVHIGLLASSIKLAIRFPNLFIWQSRLDQRRANGLCIYCCYDCRGLPTETCPECGQPHTVQN